MQIRNKGYILARWKRFGFLCLVCYWLVLIYFTLFTYNDYVYGRSLNFELFDSIKLMIESGDLGLMFKNVIGNVLLFLPHGILLPLLFWRFRNFFVMFAISVAASFLIESAQYGFAKRIFDIDDVFLNVIGAMLGWIISLVIVRISQKVKR